jgi:peptidyl-prolyl cis-trans isomerase SurA
MIKKPEERTVTMRVLKGLVLVILALPVSAQVLDRVVAVVDNEIILESELNAQVQFYVSNNKLDPNTPGVKEQVLQSMINEKLILAKAIEDSVSVSDEEVQQQLDAVIQQRVQQFGSEAKLEEVYAMPISRIKREFREEMRKNLLTQRLQQQRFGSTNISRRQVEDFFQTYKDSLGNVPEEVELAHIYIKPGFDKEAHAVARAKAQAILDSIKAGADFASLAKRNSEDIGSAQQGGDLGFVRRGQFVKEFEAAVFSLAENQLSGLVETEFGIHIIQLLGRRGDAVHPRHILIRVPRTESSDQVAITLLDSIRTAVLGGANFAELAKKYSQDESTAPVGGDLGTAELEAIPDKSLYATVLPMKAGEISKPEKLQTGNNYGYHIVWMKKRTPAHPLTLDGDYQRIETIALNYKRTKDYQAWLEDLKSKIYWQSRL